MTATTVCSPSLLPTYADLKTLFDPFTGLDISWPAQLTLPSPVWPSIKSPSAEGESTITEMLNSQLVGMLMALLTPITDFLGLDLATILPDVPGFPGVTLIEIVDGTALPEMIEAVETPGFDFSLIALLPDPIYPDLVTPAREALSAVQSAINGYYQTITTLISDLIAMVTDDLMLPGMPALPTFPTLADIMALLPPFPTYADLLALNIPVFGELLASMPDPLMPPNSSQSYDFLQGLKNLWTAMTNYVTAIIVDFVASLPLSFDFPTFCLTFDVPDPV